MEYYYYDYYYYYWNNNYWKVYKCEIRKKSLIWKRKFSRETEKRLKSEKWRKGKEAEQEEEGWRREELEAKGLPD